MPRKVMLVVLAAIVLGAWAICGTVYATNGGGAYNGGVFATLIFVAAFFTLAAAVTLVGAWSAGSGASLAELRVVAATVVSLLAGVSTLVLAVAINSRG
jgi:hypothetical protein